MCMKDISNPLIYLKENVCKSVLTIHYSKIEFINNLNE